MEAEVLKYTVLNNTIKESKPIPAEKQVTSQMLILPFLNYYLLSQIQDVLYSCKYS